MSRGRFSLWHGALALALSVLAPQVLADAASMHARHHALGTQLHKNSFQQALHIDSAEAPDTLRGDVHAVLDHPFARVRDALTDPASWCDVLILPFNTKYCHSQRNDAGAALLVRIGRKFDQPVEKAYRIDFSFRNTASSADYFESRIEAPAGPLGTRDYRISVRAIPLAGGRTFMHLSYAYGYGTAGRLAMQGYLATVGSQKVGFTVAGRGADGQPQYIGGVRGAVERNAMRYYLAIDSFLDALPAPPAQRPEKRIQSWFTATERYPLQLREMDRPTYVAMKRHEVERQRTLLE